MLRRRMPRHECHTPVQTQTKTARVERANGGASDVVFRPHQGIEIPRVQIVAPAVAIEVVQPDTAVRMPEEERPPRS